MTDKKPNTEEEMVKEAFRLSKEVEYLVTHEPSKEDVLSYVKRMIEEIKEGKMTLSPPLTKNRL